MPAPGAASDGLLQVLLLNGAHAVEAKIGERTEQSGARRCLQPVGVVAKFNEQIEDPLRHRPVKHAVTAELGAGIVRNKQHIGAVRIGWRISKLTLKDAKPAAAAQLMRDQTNRDWAF